MSDELREYFKGCFSLSYSDFKNYNVCPYRYFLYEQSKLIKPRPKRTTDSRNYLDGWVAHKCLELWNKKGHWASGWLFDVVVETKHTPEGWVRFNSIGRDIKKANLVNEIMKEFLLRNFVKWRFDTDSTAAHTNIVKGLHKIEYWVETLKFNSNYVHSEKWFNIELPRLNVLVKGAVDLVDFRTFDLLDMKFSKTSTYVDWTQLKFYDMMLSLKYNRKVRRVGTFCPLHPEPMEYQENSKEDLKEFVNELEEVIEKIRRQEFKPNNSDSNDCYMCIVRDSCKYSAYKYNKSVEVLENVRVDEEGRKKVGI